MVWRSYNALVNKSDLLVLDSRSELKFKEGHIRGSICVRAAAGSLHHVLGPRWSSNCWWGKDVLVVPGQQPAQEKNRKRKRTADPVVKLLEEEGLVKSLQVMEDDEGFDPFTCFARRYPFLVTKSLKPAKVSSYPAEIVPELLYLGDMDHAVSIRILEDLHVTHILTVHTEKLKAYEGFSHLYFDLADEPNGDIARHFDEAFEFIEQAKNLNRRVLVHCGAGASRSATLCAYYIMRTKQWTAEKAVKFLREQRKQVDPNPGFLAQLERYERTSKSINCLRVLKDGVIVNTLDLSEKMELLFGRLPECNVVMDHASISRKHARLFRSEKSWFLVDLGSAHGTFVNGGQLAKETEHELRPDDVVRFGASTRQYVFSTGE